MAGQMDLFALALFGGVAATPDPIERTAQGAGQAPARPAASGRRPPATPKPGSR